MSNTTTTTTRDRWRYEDTRLFCNDQYVAALEANDGDESTCEYIAKTLDDYGRAIADYEHELATLRRELEREQDDRRRYREAIDWTLETVEELEGSWHDTLIAKAGIG